MKNLAIIPARGGSKRIPRKNIKVFNGKPVIVYSIKAAIDSKCFDEVMVSTDDKEISEVSIYAGAKVPFLRSEATANDFVGIAEVVLEVISQYKKLGKEFDNICVLLPTAPFVTTARLKEGFKKLTEDFDAVTAIVKYGYPVQRALKVENSCLKMLWPENYIKRSQDLEPVYHDAGQFYWIKTKTFLEQKKFFTQKNAYIQIPELEVQDIDTEEDWNIAEIKYKYINK